MYVCVCPSSLWINNELLELPEQNSGGDEIDCTSLKIDLD